MKGIGGIAIVGTVAFLTGLTAQNLTRQHAGPMAWAIGAGGGVAGAWIAVKATKAKL